MDGVGWLMTVVIGGFAGWVAERIMKARHGMLTNIFVGILGAVVLNGFLVLILGRTWGGWIGQFLVAIAGACLLIWGYRMFRGTK